MFRCSVLLRLTTLSIAFGFLVMGAPISSVWSGEAAKPAELPIGRGLTQRLANFTLKDVTTGRNITLYDYRGKKAIVLVSLGTDCPVGNLYVPRLNELNKEFAKKDIVFLGINSNDHETEQDVAKYVADRGIDFPVLKDPKNLIADAAMIERTCEVIVLDRTARARYRGAIDDQYVQGKAKDAPDHHYLREALTAILANRKIDVPATKVAGCLIDRVEARPVANASGPRIRAAAPEVASLLDAREKEHPIEVGKVTYAADVAGIIQNKCQNCHRPGQVAPFSLLTYDDAKKHTGMIREVVEERRMPPWHADPRYGHFANDRSLSAKERATLMAWIDQGGPLGDARQLPPPRTFRQGWAIGKPDVVFEIPETFNVPAQGVVSYRYYQVKTNFKEDMWVQAAEAVPGDRSVVHHIIVYLIDPKAPPGPGGRPRVTHFTGFAPGDAPSIFAEGTAKRIPVGSELLFQVHYTPIGKITPDRSKVGLVFAKTKPKREAFTVGIANTDFFIPPYRDSVGAGSSWVLPEGARLLSMFPHMHLRGKDFKFTITKPGEPPQVALSVPAYDFSWQTYYVLPEPIDLPKGTRIDCLAHFDNSEGNPYNPDPSKLVRFGEQTFEEMLIGYCDMDVAVGDPLPEAPQFESGIENALLGLRDTWQGFVRRGKSKDQARGKHGPG